MENQTEQQTTLTREDRERIIRFGDAAEKSLHDGTLAIAINSLIAQYVQGWITSSDEETQKRERFYFRARAAGDIIAELRSAVSDRDRLIAQPDEGENGDDTD